MTPIIGILIFLHLKWYPAKGSLKIRQIGITISHIDTNTISENVQYDLPILNDNI